MTVPTEPASEKRTALVARAFALCVACPLNQDNPADCPLHTIRHMPVTERFAWVKQASDMRLSELCDHHCSCLTEKERALHRHRPSTSIEPDPRKNS